MAKSKKQPKRRERSGRSNTNNKQADNGESFDDVLRESGIDSAEATNVWTNPLTIAVLCGVVSLALYWNTHQNKFAYDDYAAIVYNPDTRGQTPIGDLLKNDFWGQTLALAGSNKSWRPLTILSFRINHTLHGLNASSFHIWNNVLNAITAYIAVFTVASLRNGSSPSYLIVSSLLFAFHPIHTEAVTNTVGRAESLGAILAFSAFYFHWKSMTNSKQSYFYVLVAMALGFTSALAKEPCLMVLGICGAHEIAAIWLPMTSTTTTTTKGKRGANENINWKELGPSMTRFFMLAITGIGYMSMRVIINGEGLGVKPQFKDNPLLFTDSKLSFVLTALHIQATYAWKLLYPMNFSCDYGYNVIPMVEGFGDPRNIGTVVWMVSLVGLTVKGLMDARDKSDSRLLVALAWIVGPLIPASHILALGTVLAERLLYVPSLGYGMIVGLIVEYFVRNGKDDDNSISASPKLKDTKVKPWSTAKFMSFLPLFGVVLAYYGNVIIKRNRNWYNDDALWEADFKTHPDNIKISTMWTRRVMDAGNYHEAMRISQEKYDMLPNDIGNLCVLAKATAFSGKENAYERAHELLDEGVAIIEGRIQRPKANDFEVYSAKGYILSKQERIEESREFYKKALDLGSRRDPESEKPNCNMGEIEAVAGNWEESVPYLERCANNVRAKKGDGDYIKYLENLVKAYYMSKQHDKVLERAPEALSIQETEIIRKIYDHSTKIVAKSERATKEEGKGGGGGDE